jgi:Type I phosphodiesterase / nucleotide pyrophosphatase
MPLSLGWPNFGLRFDPSANISHYLSLLQEYSTSHPDAPFKVYTRETMPERYHFSHNERIAPIYICPELGWIVSNHHEVPAKWGGKEARPKGVSFASLFLL